MTEGTFHCGFQETDESCLDYGNKHGQNVRLKAHVSYLKIMKLLDKIFFQCGDLVSSAEGTDDKLSNSEYNHEANFES